MMTDEPNAQLEQFRQVYFDECAELLEALDAEATSLRPGEQDGEKLNAIFRAVHSIKAGAGAFKFARLVAFSHIFESALDLVRNGQIVLDEPRIALVVRCSDLLSDLVAAAQESSDLSPDYEADATAELETLLADGGRPRNAALAQEIAAPAGAEPGAVQHYDILFRPNLELFHYGNEPLFILRELQGLGECQVTLDTERLPTYDRFDPEDCYVGWRIELKTARPRADIEAAFEFVADDCDVSIVYGEIASEESDSPKAAEVGRAPAATSDVSNKDLGEPAEDAGGPAAPRHAKSATIRVDLERIDRLVNMVGELVIAQSMALQALSETTANGGAGQLKGLEDLSLRTRELQEGVMAIRMQPVKSVFSRMPRVVRDLSAALNKKVRLEMIGEATEIDKTVIEELSDPLTHMIRNSLDHGLESPEERRAAGKPEAGVITLSAAHRCGRIDISVSDDGRGLDLAKLKSRAIDRGLIAPDADLSEAEVAQLIFAPGFSTAEAVSEVSGRGVGMDVVRRNIQNLGGRISIDTAPGRGSTFTLTLPLTLAVLDGMLIAVGGERYILPVGSIFETIRPEKKDLRQLADGRNVLAVRGVVTPLVHVGAALNVRGAVARPEDGLVVLSETEMGRRVGLVVDELLGQQQVVVKNLEEHYVTVPGVSGATILGDGRIALILDVDGLASLTGGAGLPLLDAA